MAQRRSEAQSPMTMKVPHQSLPHLQLPLVQAMQQVLASPLGPGHRDTEMLDVAIHHRRELNLRWHRSRKACHDADAQAAKSRNCVRPRTVLASAKHLHASSQRRQQPHHQHYRPMPTTSPPASWASLGSSELRKAQQRASQVTATPQAPSERQVIQQPTQGTRQSRKPTAAVLRQRLRPMTKKHLGLSEVLRHQHQVQHQSKQHPLSRVQSHTRHRDPQGAKNLQPWQTQHSATRHGPHYPHPASG